MSNLAYAISKLITAMGMFIHDLRELKCGDDCVYTERAYDSLAEDILHTVKGEPE